MKTTQKPTKVVHQLGNFYRTPSGQIWLLCSPKIGTLSLVSLATGSRLSTEPVLVGNIYSVSEIEWDKITSHSPDQFIWVNIEEIIYT